MNLSDLQTELDTIAPGIPVATRKLLLNEGYRELAVRSEWTRAYRDFGPTVSGTAAYAVPSDCYRIIRLSVDGKPYAPGDGEVVEEITDNTAFLRARGIYYTTFSSSGTESIGLYPVPDESGLTINALIIYRPTDLTSSSSSPVVPAEFHRAIVDYAAAQWLTSAENADRRDEHSARFEVAVDKLLSLRFSRQAREPAVMQIAGIHFRPEAV